MWSYGKDEMLCWKGGILHMPDEVWLPVREFEGIYEVSQYGNIRSLARRGRPTTGLIRPSRTTPLNPYMRVFLWGNGIHKTLNLHRLVAEAHVANPDKLSQVNHKDGLKDNNAASNLEWVTPGDNIQHAYDAGLKGRKWRKYSLLTQINIWHCQGYLGQRKTAIIFGVPPTYVRNIWIKGLKLI